MLKRILIKCRALRRFQTGPGGRVTVVVTSCYRDMGGRSESCDALVAAYREAFEKAREENR
jgi:hypothetical protein